MASVFLSYDHEDAALARPLARALEKAGHEVWWDQFIHSGAQYSRKIEQALDEADAVVVLWTPRSVESAWVRDEAADGRDRGKLVPLSAGGVSPPMGFRQFQTLDLGGWKGRGKLPRLTDLLEAIDTQAKQAASGRRQPDPVVAKPMERGVRRRWLLLAGLITALVAMLGLGWWWWGVRTSLPVVEVAAANSSARSQAAASDLFVKLGSLAQVGKGKWQLVDASSAPAKPALVFRTADTGRPDHPEANLVLLDGKDDALLWSREFSFPASGEADLRQQLALTAGRVLGCALESRSAGGLPRDLLKLYLNACALLAEASLDEPNTVTSLLRTVVETKPSFTPAWGRILFVDTSVLSGAYFNGAAEAAATRQLRTDMESARKVAPDLPELRLAEVALLPKTDFGRSLQLLDEAVAKSPDNALIFAERAGARARVGRNSDAIADARRSAELDPLAPAATTQLIMTLAYGGQVDEARKELARAERLWSGTGALRDALWAFNLRFGDPAIARRYASFTAKGLDFYLAARADPSKENVDRLARYLRESAEEPSLYAGAVQALAEFGRVDEAFRSIARTPPDWLAGDSYIFFRPSLVSLRRDPRFMQLAHRIGLLRYWRSSGQWPDFCNEAGLPYDCRAEAAKYA